MKKLTKLNALARLSVPRSIFSILSVGLIALVMSSCTTSQLGISDSNAFIRFEKEDFSISEKISATAVETRILGIDFGRLFKKESGNFDSRGYAINPKVPVPFLSNKLTPTTVQNYTMHRLLSENPDYDVVLYPRFEEKEFNVLGLYRKTDTKVSARLGKL